MNKTARKILKSIFGSEFYDKCLYIKKKIQFKSKKTDNYCPCCNNYVRKWQSFRKYNWVDLYNADIFEPIRDKCNCPICDCAPRHRIEASWLNTLDISGQEVLLWAPENGILMYLKNKKVKLTTADLKMDTVMCRENIESTSFEKCQFDFIICNHVLEHVSNLMKALKETYRILKDNGIALIMVPQDLSNEDTLEYDGIISEEDRKRMYGQADHVRLFGRNFSGVLKKAGFIVEEYNGQVECGGEILPLIAPSLYDSNILYICKKSKLSGLS